MNYQDKITLRNKHHISSALYHLERVVPDILEDKQSGKFVGVQDLNTIREHLFAIADAWDAAANALERALSDDVTSLLLSIVGISAFVSVVSVFAYRRRKV